LLVTRSRERKRAIVSEWELEVLARVLSAGVRESL
jgi:hypothetical protein